MFANLNVSFKSNVCWGNFCLLYKHRFSRKICISGFSSFDFTDFQYYYLVRVLSVVPWELEEEEKVVSGDRINKVVLSYKHHVVLVRTSLRIDVNQQNYIWKNGNLNVKSSDPYLIIQHNSCLKYSLHRTVYNKLYQKITILNILNQRNTKKLS